MLLEAPRARSVVRLHAAVHPHGLQVACPLVLDAAELAPCEGVNACAPDLVHGGVVLVEALDRVGGADVSVALGVPGPLVRVLAALVPVCSVVDDVHGRLLGADDGDPFEGLRNVLNNSCHDGFLRVQSL